MGATAAKCYVYAASKLHHCFHDEEQNLAPFVCQMGFSSDSLKHKLSPLRYSMMQKFSLRSLGPVL